MLKPKYTVFQLSDFSVCAVTSCRYQLSLALSFQQDSLTDHSLSSLILKRMLQTLEALFQESRCGDEEKMSLLKSAVTRRCNEERKRLLDSAIGFVKVNFQCLPILQKIIFHDIRLIRTENLCTLTFL